MVLVIGGMGFIGMHIARHLLDAGESLVLTQHSARREPDFIKSELGKRVAIETMDVTNPYNVFDVVKRHKPGVIISTVAPPARGSTPRGDMQVYTQGLLNVLEAARVNEAKRVILASSISVYTGLPTGPFKETDLLPVESKTQVEAFKKATEVLALHYSDRTGLPVVCARLASIYGPLYYSMFNVPSRLVHAAVKGAAPDFPAGIPFEEDEADWCHVADVSKGVQLLATAETLSHRTYNLGSGRNSSHGDVLRAAKKAVPGFDFQLQPGLGPAGRKGIVMDCSRARGEVGYSPQFDIEQGVADYVGWLKDHPE